MFVSTERELYLLEKVPFSEQIDDLVNQGDYEEALQLCQMMDSGVNIDEKVPYRRLHLHHLDLS